MSIAWRDRIATIAPMGGRRVRRASIVLAAVLYLLGGTNLALGLLDRIAPLEVAVAHADFRCAHHACGCASAEQCRAHCCCSGETDEALPVEQESSNERAVSYVTLARCAGHGDPGISPGGGIDHQSLPSAVVLPPPARERRSPRRPIDLEALSALERPPSKVPI
jgi:hypothetical protein